MPEEVYVYSKPKAEFDFRKILILAVIAAVGVVAVAIYAIMGGTGNTAAPAVTYDFDGNTYYVADSKGLTGEAGLAHVKTNSRDALEKAKSDCTERFQGSWVDTSSEIGCYYMQDFEDYYCGFHIVSDLAQLCMQIGGTYDCSSSQAFCRV